MGLVRDHWGKAVFFGAGLIASVFCINVAFQLNFSNLGSIAIGSGLSLLVGVAPLFFKDDLYENKFFIELAFLAGTAIMPALFALIGAGMLLVDGGSTFVENMSNTFG